MGVVAGGRESCVSGRRKVPAKTWEWPVEKFQQELEQFVGKKKLARLPLKLNLRVRNKLVGLTH